MESRAKAMGHPIHQMLIVFPLGLLGASVVFDVLFLVTERATLADAAFWMIVAGLVGGLIAAPFGLIDWLAIPSGTRAKRVGLYHAITNLGVMLLFLISALVRGNAHAVGTPSVHEPGPAAVILSLMGVGLALIGGWLGGELVDRMGVGVHDGAHVDAPNSLSGRPTTDRASV